MANGPNTPGGPLAQAAAAAQPAPAQAGPVGPPGPVTPGPAAPAGPGPGLPPAPPPQAQGPIDPNTGLPPVEMPEGDPTIDPNLDIGGEPATAEEEKELQRGLGALDTILYGGKDTGIADAFLGQIDPNDKIGSLARATTFLVKTVDEKIELQDTVIAAFTMSTLDKTIELTEAQFPDVQYSDRDKEVLLGSTWEAISDIFGVGAEEMTEVGQTIPEDQREAMAQQYINAKGG